MLLDLEYYSITLTIVGAVASIVRRLASVPTEQPTTKLRVLGCWLVWSFTSQRLVSAHIEYRNRYLTQMSRSGAAEIEEPHAEADPNGALPQTKQQPYRWKDQKYWHGHYISERRMCYHNLPFLVKEILIIADLFFLNSPATPETAQIPTIADLRKIVGNANHISVRFLFSTCESSSVIFATVRVW
jgi:hypothetical protein